MLRHAGRSGRGAIVICQLIAGIWTPPSPFLVSRNARRGGVIGLFVRATRVGAIWPARVYVWDVSARASLHAVRPLRISSSWLKTCRLYTKSMQRRHLGNNSRRLLGKQPMHQKRMWRVRSRPT